jgi:predicted amidohydrolase
MKSAIVMAAACAALLAFPAAAEINIKTTADQPPRKVIVGTAMQAYWEVYPGLEKRLAQLAGMVDQMAAESQKKYGRGLDLAILPETSVTGESSGDAIEHSVPYDGPLRDVFSRKAREHRSYIVVPTYLLEDKQKKLCSNAAILFGRKGELVGIYRKVHLAVPTGRDSLEDGTTPGKEVPVFNCDFGKLGIQICFDMEYDHGWAELARKGAELVAWPTQSPQTSHPAWRAFENRYHIVSSTWRDNASFFEPTGKITAQIRLPQHILVEQLDLSYAILPWSSRLKNGAALKEKYGDKVGFHYYVDEDRGQFWSNNPQLTIGEMIRSLGLSEEHEELSRIRKLYDKAGVPAYRDH